MAGAVINSREIIGNGCIINTCFSVDYDCRIGDFVYVSLGAYVTRTIEISDRTWIDEGVAVPDNINIYGDSMIGAGAMIVKDIVQSGTYIGLPAEKKNMRKYRGEDSARLISSAFPMQSVRRRAA